MGAIGAMWRTCGVAVLCLVAASVVQAPAAVADVYGIAAAVPAAPAIGAQALASPTRSPRSLPAIGALLPTAPASSVVASRATAGATIRPIVAAPHPWLAHHRAEPDVFEQFTNAVTSNRQRFVFGISLSEYTVTGLRVAMRF